MPAVKITNKPVSTPGDQTHFLVTQPELPEGYAPTGQETEEELAELKVESLREIEMDDMVELFQKKFAFDSEPTAESVKPVTSAGIKAALDAADAEIGELKENIDEKTKPVVTAVPNEAVVDTTNLTKKNIGGAYGYGDFSVPFANGTYYANPLSADSKASIWGYCFKDATGSNIEMTKTDDGTVVTELTGRRPTSVFAINGLIVTETLYLDYDKFIANNVYFVRTYTLAETPACIYIHRLYTDDHTIDGVCNITKDAWSEEYKPWGGVNYVISDQLKNQIDSQTEERYGILSQKRTVITFDDEIVQCVDPSEMSHQRSGDTYRYSNIRIYLPYNGRYYFNPPASGITYYVGKAYNKYGKLLQMHHVSTYTGKKTTTTSFNLSTNNVHGKISLLLEDKRRLYFIYFNNDSEWCDHYTEFSEDIAYLQFDYVGYFNNETTLFGVTYGSEHDEYVPFDNTKIVKEEAYAPSVELGENITEYQNISDRFSNRCFNYVYPENESLFSFVTRYRNARRERTEKGIFRIASFNKFISRTNTNYATIKKELADYDIDICALQETSVTIQDGVVTDRIEQYLIDNFQFVDGYNGQINTGKGLVSHWAIDSFDTYELLTSDRETGYCIRCKITIPSEKWYSNVVSADTTLSVYSVHLSAYNVTIDGVGYTSLQYRLMEINKILEYIAQDTSDFIVVCGDTNCFEPGFNTENGTHQEWELFRSAGLIPLLPGTESTVTGDTQQKMFYKVGDTVHCLCAYDQIFVTPNVSMTGYKIVDSNMYKIDTVKGNPPVSDHCMIYADLKFDFESVMQNKLKDIAVTTKWW